MISLPDRQSPQTLKKVAFPFLTTSPLLDLQMLLILTPVWWVLGVDQLVWPVMLTIPTFKLLRSRNYRIHVTPTIRWLTLFTIIYLLSAFFIVNPIRIITFLRSFSVYITALMVITLCLECIGNQNQLMRIVDSLILVITVAAVIGFLAITDIYRPHFSTVMDSLLPNSIKSTGYGGRIAVKYVGSMSWFSWFGSFFRVRSLFMYSTHYAAALVITFPLIMFRWQVTKGLWPRMLVLLITILVLINLAFTTARMSTLALTAGGLYYLLFVVRERRALQLIALFAAVIFMGTALYLSLFEPVTFNPAEQIPAKIESFADARGGSTSDRMDVYRVTVKGWMERPLLGWGTERDVEGAAYPAGSHSMYLGTLYKQGIFGFLALVGLYIALWRELDPIRSHRNCPNRTLNLLVDYGRWVLVVFFLGSMTDTHDLDALTSMLLWTTFGILLAASHCLRYGKQSHAV